MGHNPEQTSRGISALLGEDHQPRYRGDARQQGVVCLFAPIEKQDKSDCYFVPFTIILSQKCVSFPFVIRGSYA